jgi:hypothetical protein
MRWLLALIALGIWVLWRRLNRLEIQGDILPPLRPCPSTLVWAWLRFLGREKPRFYYGEDQIAIQANGRAWSSEDGDEMPEDLLRLSSKFRRPSGCCRRRAGEVLASGRGSLPQCKPFNLSARRSSRAADRPKSHPRLFSSASYGVRRVPTGIHVPFRRFVLA